MKKQTTKAASARLKGLAAAVRRISDIATVQEDYGRDTSKLFPTADESDEDIATITVQATDGQYYQYVPWGDDDDTPLKVRRLMEQNMITAQGMAFDILCCYGQGIKVVDRETRKPCNAPDIQAFLLRNSVNEAFMEMATDMKYYYFTVTELILSRDRQRIVRLKHLDTCYCRLERKDERGRIAHVLYGDFRDGTQPRTVTAIPLLDPLDPLSDLLVRTGAEPDTDTGQYRAEPGYKFAVLSRMPTPGNRYYPQPYYMSIFHDHWYDIYKLIGLGKKYMIKNTSAPRLQIEVHEDYWQNVCDYEGIIDDIQRKQRIDQEHQNLVDFVCGPQNAGKAMITNYYIDPNGKENRMVRVMNLSEGSKKEGGDWADDMVEASNALCFALGVHPNLIGATPGKAQMNNSGSDKRELFTLKQATEKAFHDIMLKPFQVMFFFNQWAAAYDIDVPMIELTTLDKHTDAQEAVVGD